MRRPLARHLAALALLSVGCGKSVSEDTDSGPGDASAGGTGGTLGTGGSIILTGGSSSGGGSAGATNAGSSNTGGAGGDPFALCRSNTNFITVSGALPTAFGPSATLDAGCTESFRETYPWPTSSTAEHPEAPGIGVQLTACTRDEHLKVTINERYGTTSSPYIWANIVFEVDGAIYGQARITLDETRTPLERWPFPTELSEGVGQSYEGTFDDSEFTDGGPSTVTGSFSVCHVANWPRG